MPNRTLAIILIVLGLVFLAVAGAILVDTQQIVSLLAGAALLISGLIMLFSGDEGRTETPENADPPTEHGEE
jgi:uncharacterized membrane protein